MQEGLSKEKLKGLWALSGYVIFFGGEGRIYRVGGVVGGRLGITDFYGTLLLFGREIILFVIFGLINI